MRTELLLALAQRDLPPDAATWLYMAFQELGLAEAGLRLHQEHRAIGGIGSATTHAFGGHSQRTTGVHVMDLMAKHRPTNHIEAAPVFAEMAFPGEASELAARGFVYALAVLRNALRRAGQVSPDPVAAAATMTAFDAAVPGLVPVRDSLAHLDERYAGESRGRPINPIPATIDGEALALGSAIEADRISAHTADGTLQSVALTSDTVGQAIAALLLITQLFPLKPVP